MKIYTVVGLSTDDSYTIIKSFAGKEKADGLLDECRVADETKPRYQVGVRIVDELRVWEDNHPAGNEYHYDSYDVIEHELVGVDDTNGNGHAVMAIMPRVPDSLDDKEGEA